MGRVYFKAQKQRENSVIWCCYNSLEQKLFPLVFISPLEKWAVGSTHFIGIVWGVKEMVHHFSIGTWVLPLQNVSLIRSLKRKRKEKEKQERKEKSCIKCCIAFYVQTSFWNYFHYILENIEYWNSWWHLQLCNKGGVECLQFSHLWLSFYVKKWRWTSVNQTLWTKMGRKKH